MTENKSLEVRFCFLDDESKQKCKEEAKKQGLTLSSWVRSAIYRQLNSVIQKQNQ